MSFINLLDDDGAAALPTGGAERRIELDDSSDQSAENVYQSPNRYLENGQNRRQDDEDGTDSEETDDQNPVRSAYFDTAANYYVREKYPKKKRKNECEEGPQPETDRGGDEGGEDKDGKAAYGGRKRRAAVYRHATSTSTYYLHNVYGQLRGTKVSNAVRGEYKPVIDTTRSPPAARIEMDSEDQPAKSQKNRYPYLGGIDRESKKENIGNAENGSKISSQNKDEEAERLAGIVERDILDTTAINVSWDEIAGLGRVKKIIQEIVVWPMLRPELFTGLRALPRGLLLFGPPGTGKTTLGRCIASQAKATFYCISASSLTSKWVGENEKLVRALFESARAHQPAVVFIDEIDALLSNRTDGEHDSTRRLKTQFFTELDGAKTFSEERVLVVGATNRPGDLDDAARRRLTKRLYVPLPDTTGRIEMLTNLLKRESHSLGQDDIDSIAARTEGFSCDDLKKMCQEAALGPVRRVMDIATISKDELPPITMADFESALVFVRPSVAMEQLAQYEDFDRRFGSAGAGV